jgi:hypothetical protein
MMNVTQLSNVVSPNLLRGFKQLFLELPEFICRYATKLVITVGQGFRNYESGQHVFTL